MNPIIYDIETFPNIFTLAAKEAGTDRRWNFEISWRVNQIDEMMEFLTHLKMHNIPMVGFNNVGFDYPVIHFIIQNRYDITVEMIYAKAKQIIDTPFEDRFSNIIWENNHFVPQIDLFKIHHFDNRAKSTSLKVLEFNMRMESVEDLPFPVGTLLTSDQMDELIDYNDHDIDATEKFYFESTTQIEFRQELSIKYQRNVMNHNDTKIGKDYFINELEDHSPGVCYDYSSGKKKLRQTHRSIIHFRDILLPCLGFTHPEFQRVHEWFKLNSIVNTKGALVAGGLSATVRDFRFDFGTGGIHGSIAPCMVVSDEEYAILDIDVTSFYPSIAIANGLSPAHLGEKFCDIYSGLKRQRVGYKKGTVENLMLKLALNGTYGDTNSIYSALYDPQYTMAITVNGQLLLCMLAEVLMGEQSVSMIQINTDGMTFKVPRTFIPWVRQVMKWWEGVTGLDLEEAEYKRFFVRDVNNYIAEKMDGKCKRKGAYEHEQGPGKLEWNQNFSSLVVQKAAEARLLHGTDIREFIENHDDIHDFMLRTKVNRTDWLMLVDYDGVDHEIQRVSRYYISMIGGDLMKIMKPTKKQLEKNANAPLRRISINAGYKACVCNQMSDLVQEDVEYEWYITEARKLVDPILKGGVL